MRVTTGSRTRGAMAVRGLLLIAGLLVAAAGAVPAAGPGAQALAADEAVKKSVDADAVYFGDAREWSRPAEVDADAVYAAIPEYREILEQKLESSDPKYGILMTKARKKFLHAVRTSAKESGYDLVARVGSVKGVEGVPVITDDVISRL